MTRTGGGGGSSSSASFDGKKACANLNDLTLFSHDFNDSARGGAGNFNGGFVGHDLKQGLILFNRITLFDEPANNFTFINAFTDIWEFKFK
jgi:hypothetical protein